MQRSRDDPLPDIEVAQGERIRCEALRSLVTVVERVRLLDDRVDAAGRPHRLAPPRRRAPVRDVLVARDPWIVETVTGRADPRALAVSVDDLAGPPARTRQIVGNELHDYEVRLQLRRFRGRAA